jgi:ATP-binding cassette subfamily C protein
VDDVDVATCLGGWQRLIGYVPQAVYLIDDTVRRNVAFGCRDEEIDDGRVWAALGMARLDAFVRRLPSGLDATVGERGVRFSGGEQQRIAIARALYHDPRLLVFDEATSSLDSETEREITQAIEALRGRKTLLIVAHRLSTVRGCDRLLYLREGRAVDCGTFEELLGRNASFRAMATAGPVHEAPFPGG